jgi:transposase-like protein
LKKYTNLNYEQCVTLAKGFLENRKIARIEICLLALRVCDIQYGGHYKGSDIYSLKKFADDIGIKATTLRKWVEDFRNVSLKLPEIPSESMSKAVREVAKKVTNKTSKEEVVRLYREFTSMSQEDYSLLAQIKYCKAVRNFILETNLANLNQDNVSELFGLIDYLTDLKGRLQDGLCGAS